MVKIHIIYDILSSSNASSSLGYFYLTLKFTYIMLYNIDYSVSSTYTSPYPLLSNNAKDTYTLKAITFLAFLSLLYQLLRSNESNEIEIIIKF